MEKNKFQNNNSDKIICMYKRFSYRLDSDEKRLIDYFRTCNMKERQILLMFCEPDKEKTDESALPAFKTG